MILCVTPNPALDRVILVRDLQPGMAAEGKHTLTVAAGKGVSTARAVRALGGDPVCAGFLGGDYGAYHEELLKSEGLKTAWTRLDSSDAETRTTYVIVDPVTGRSTVINEPGPTVSAEDWARLHADVMREAALAKVVSFSGSLPAGSPPDLFAHLISELCKAGRRVWVDTSGDPLRSAILACPAAIKINGGEAGSVLGTRVQGIDSAVLAANELRQRGIGTVVISLGEMGAILSSSEGNWWAQPPMITVASAVGSGDSLLAGIMCGVAGDIALPDALRQGVAAGGANALSLGAGQFTRSEFEAVLAGTTLKRIS
jgi:1-phosphofructokinase family hexose kinase